VKQATIQQWLLSNDSVNNNRGIVFLAWSVPMAVHVTMEYVMPLLSNKRNSVFCVVHAVTSRTNK
jgi:hypothetical protein